MAACSAAHTAPVPFLLQWFMTGQGSTRTETHFIVFYHLSTLINSGVWGFYFILGYSRFILADSYVENQSVSSCKKIVLDTLLILKFGIFFIWWLFLLTSRSSGLSGNYTWERNAGQTFSGPSGQTAMEWEGDNQPCQTKKKKKKVSKSRNLPGGVSTLLLQCCCPWAIFSVSKVFFHSWFLPLNSFLILCW